MTKKIESLQNVLVKQAVGLRKKPERRDRAIQILVAGRKLIGEALKSGAGLKHLFLTNPSNLDDSWTVLSEQICLVSPAIMKKVTDLDTPPPCAAIVTLPAPPALEEITSTARTLIILDRIQDPGNLGTILRTCEGLMADGVILTEGSCSLWNPKVQRAAMGSLFRLPCREGVTNEVLLSLLPVQGFRLIGTSAQGTPLSVLSLPPKTALIFGNEGRGLHPTLSQACCAAAAIPLHPNLESLNVAAAVAVFLYERWRGLRTPRCPVSILETDMYPEENKEIV